MDSAPPAVGSAVAPGASHRIRLSSPQKQAIRELHEIPQWSNLRILTFLAIWAAATFLALNVSILPLRVLCWFLAGASIQGLGILMHEGAHGNLFRNRRLNNLVGFLCGIPALLSLTAYRLSHLAHHRHARGPEDPDELENLSRNPRVLSIIFLFILLAGDLYGFYFVGPLGSRRGSRADRRATLLEYSIIAGVFATAFLLVPFRVMLQVWLLPVLFARQLTNVRTLAEHALTRADSRWLATRTVLSNRFVSFFMCNVNYHIEHHIFPRIPYRNVARVHELLKEDLERIGAHICPSYSRFLWELGRFTFRSWGAGGQRVPLALST
jgi:fatty acid desaturase